MLFRSKDVSGDAPVIALTGLGGRITMEECYINGADGFLLKDNLSEARIKAYLAAV